MSLTSTLRHFIANSDGNVAVISAFAILPMLVLAGGATDIARHEAYRAQLQDGVDRAVLAAASLTQKRPVEDTVKDYLRVVPFIDEADVRFTRDEKINSREVTVTAHYDMPTAFLPLIGIDTLGVSALATAVERRQNVEISLMLDFSGSMIGNRFNQLKPAARDFVDAMLTPDTKSYTSMSVVPYAGQVSVGAWIFNTLGGARSHSNSSCFVMNTADFAKGLVNFSGRAQVPHFTVWNGSADKPTLPANLNPGWCPSDNTSISFLSNDANFLKSQINGYQMYDGTGSNVAMNWGLMLLDPSLQPLIAQAASAGLVPSSFANRPAPFNDGETIKVIVLMTDGAITQQYTAKDPNLPVRTSNNHKVYVEPGTNITQNDAQAEKLLFLVCDTAKAKNVIVFTIGFEINPGTADGKKIQKQMGYCASSPSHFFDVKGLNINAAFQSIASAIQKIKLTQ